MLSVFEMSFFGALIGSLMGSFIAGIVGIIIEARGSACD